LRPIEPKSTPESIKRQRLSINSRMQAARTPGW
jgi:hypothetical protein